MDTKSFGQLIKMLRERKHLTQENLASMLNVSTSTVCKWEKGNNLPDINIFSNISEVLDVSFEDLHHPQNALDRLSNPTLSVNSKSNPIKSLRLIVIICILVFITISCLLLYWHSKQGENMNIVQVAFRTTQDEVCGTVYEVACVYSGNIDNITIDTPFILLLSTDWENNTSISSNITIMKVSFYDNRNDALNWNPAQKHIYLNR
ncbi:MAG: helix-turn-helix transcriptional regulator [Lachnospiraceae bacterium]|nr:helix-turn-helix transcriptional regulator [Lachnospiraceae bacterium]